MTWAETIHAASQPKRHVLLAAMSTAGVPMSAKDLAPFAGDPLENVSYHVRVLRNAGLIIARDTHMVRGAIQTFYVLSDSGRRSLKVLAELGEDAREAA